MGICLNRGLMAERTSPEGCGHGWVYPRADGAVAKCGGPAVCIECGADAARKAKAEAAHDRTWARLDRRPT